MSSNHNSIVDWDAAKRRVAELGEALNRSGTISQSDAEAILKARAQRLAQVQRQAVDDSSLEVMILKLGGEYYALETRVIREVIRSTSITRLPGAASHIAGLMNLSGRPLLVIDGRRLLGLSSSDLTESGRVVVIGGTQAEFGLLAEATDEVTALDESEIFDPPQSLAAAVRQLVRGVTRRTSVRERNPDTPTPSGDDDRTRVPLIVIHTERLMDDPRLWIDDYDE